MVSGTSYEKGYSKRYDECPRCHFRKYNKNFNSQEPKKENIYKECPGEKRNNRCKK